MIYLIGGNELFDVSDESLFKYSSVEECISYFSSKDSIQVDTETRGKSPFSKEILSLQIGDSDNQWVIDVRTTPILQFKDLLESKLVILQNAKFDYKFLKHSGIILNKIYDTMLAECVIYCGYEKWGYGLAALCKRYLNIDLDKTVRGEFYKIDSGKPFTDSQIQYAALDVAYLHKIKEKQEELIKKYDLQYCVDLECEVVKALADIEYNGMYLNADKWLANSNLFINTVSELEAELDLALVEDKKICDLLPFDNQIDLFGMKKRKLTLNYDSPIQVKFIFRLLGYDVENTDDRTLQKYVNKHKFFEILQKYRKANKIVTTYGKGFLDYINADTGRVHTSFWQVLNTGRVSSGSKDDNAPNLQNIPASNTFRNCFEARPGFLWVSSDYSGQELAIMADGSKEEGFIDVLNRGDDLHCYAGSMMFKRTITKADKELRNKAKTINFGKPYGMGPNKLAETLKISIEEAEQLFVEYAAAFPKLNKWLDGLSNFAVKNYHSRTFSPCKRIRWYPEMKEIPELRNKVSTIEDPEERRAMWKQILTTEGQVRRNGGNSPIQGTGADITKEALVEVRNLITDYNQKYKEEVAFLVCTVNTMAA